MALLTRHSFLLGFYRRGMVNAWPTPPTSAGSRPIPRVVFRQRHLRPRRRGLSKHSLASQRICSRALVMGTGPRARRRISESFRILPYPSGKAFSFLPFPLPFPSESFPFFPGFVSFQGFAGEWKRKKKKSRLLRADPEQGRRTWRAPERSRLAGTRSEAGHADVLEVHRKNSTASFDFVKTILRPGWSGCSFPKGGAGAGVRRVAVVGSAPDRTSVGRPTHACFRGGAHSLRSAMRPSHLKKASRAATPIPA